MKATLGRVVHYSNAGKVRAAVVAEVTPDSDSVLLAVLEPLATPFGLMYAHAAEITEAEALRGMVGYFWPTRRVEIHKDEPEETTMEKVGELTAALERPVDFIPERTREGGFIHLEDGGQVDDSAVKVGGTD